MIEHLDNSAQLSDIENEIIAQTLLSSVQKPSNKTARASKVTATVPDSSPKDTLPPLFRARLLDTPTLSMEGEVTSVSNDEKSIPTELKRQSNPGNLQRANSIDLTGVQPRHQQIEKSFSVVDTNYKSFIVINPENLDSQPPPVSTEKKMLVSDSSTKGAKRHSKSRSRLKNQFSRSNVVAPSDSPAIYSLEDHFSAPADHVQDSGIFQRLNERSNGHQLIRSSTQAEEEGRRKKKTKLKSTSPGRRRHSDNESVASSSGVDESLYTATIVMNRKPLIQSRSSSSSSNQLVNMTLESNAMTTPPTITPQMSLEQPPSATIFHISGNLQESKSIEEEKPGQSPSPRSGMKANPKRLNSRRSKLNTIKKIKKIGLFGKKETPSLFSVTAVAEQKALSSTSSRIDQAKADHFNSPSSAVVNLNHVLSGSESIGNDELDA